MTDALLARHSPADRVAFGGGAERTAADLLRDAAAVAAALPDKTSERPIALLGVRRDVYACTAALLGAWERGYEVLVPPADATREGFLRMAQRADVGAVLHDTASSAALPIARIFENAAPERRLPDARCVQHGVLYLAALEAEEDQPALRVTGSQLLREAVLLGRSLGLPERAAYACSLFPSTRYAWAAGVFWPLLSGGSVLRDDPRQPAWREQAARAALTHKAARSVGSPDAEDRRVASADGASASAGSVEREAAREVAFATREAARATGWVELDAAREAPRSTREAAREAAWVERGTGAAASRTKARAGLTERVTQAPLVVIGAPAQLRLLLRNAPQVFSAGQWVVSLGAPLVAAGFVQLRAAGLVVSDVFATPQLGCLGVRDAEEQGFRPLLELGLRAAADGVRLSGPQLSDADGARIQATLAADGGFVPSGGSVQRAEWEERIAWQDGVRDAALLALDAPSAPRGFYLAVSIEGEAREERALKARVMRELPELELREWRSLRRRSDAQLPVASFASGRCDLSRNAAGRHDRLSLLRLFGRAADGAALSWELSVERELVEAGHAVRYVQVPERYGYFTGHFPGYPLLPGAAQLSELVVPFVRAVRPELGRLTRMARLKFQERIVPNDLVEVSLSFGSAAEAAAEQSVEFALRRGGSVCANGRLWFASAADGGGMAAAREGAS